MGMGGSLARMFTTLKELGPKDPQMAVYGLAAFLNVALFAQVRNEWVWGKRMGGRDAAIDRVSTCSQHTHKNNR